MISLSLISDNRPSNLELQHWSLPPKYVEKFQSTVDTIKEIQMNCKNNIIFNSEHIKRKSRKETSK